MSDPRDKVSVQRRTEGYWLVRYDLGPLKKPRFRYLAIVRRGRKHYFWKPLTAAGEEICEDASTLDEAVDVVLDELAKRKENKRG